MATTSSNHTYLSTLAGIRREIYARTNNPTSNRGLFYIEGSMTIVPGDYDQAGDFIGVVQLPDNCRLLGGWISAATELDNGATPAGVYDLAIANAALSVTHTLTNASTLLNVDGEVLSWGGSATFAENEYPGIDVSQKWFGLAIETPMGSTAASSVLTFGVLVYLGAEINLGAG